MPTAYINIGSNMGDRARLIEQAVTRIEAAIGVSACRAPLYQSPAWGYKSSLPYLNLGITISTDLQPEELLYTLKSVERAISAAPHRDNNGEYIDREIDIDLISLGEISYQSSVLTLPHPRMHLRLFVLVPMACLLPDWHHPHTGHTPADMLRLLTN
jgi:2-amino-4-hydroxy-6-hydroxymethyldihydropteridine diphosphokinase